MSAGFSLENCTAGDVFFSGSKTLKVRINIGIHANYTTYNLEFDYIINRNARNRHETMNLESLKVKHRYLLAIELTSSMPGMVLVREPVHKGQISLMTPRN